MGILQDYRRGGREVEAERLLCIAGINGNSPSSLFTKEALGKCGRASGVDYDVRMFGDGAYADLAAFEPIVATDGDCYARCQVRCAEVTQAMDIIKELVGKIPHDGIGGRTKLTPVKLIKKYQSFRDFA